MTRNRPQFSPPLRRVVVATDFSTHATWALARTAKLPLAADATITLVHVLHDLPATLRARDRAESLRRLKTAGVELAAALHRRKIREVTIRTVVASGEPFLEILHHARTARAELVVMGRHGTRRFRDLLLGSTAERVIRKGDTPTLIVASSPGRPYRHPVVAMDLSTTSIRAFELAARLAADSARRLHVIHIVVVPNERMVSRTVTPPALTEYYHQCRTDAKAELDTLLKRFGDTMAPPNLVLRRGDPRQAILAIARAERTDLLALGTHGRTGLPHLLLGSVAEGVIRHAPCDVLVAKPARARLPHALAG